MAAKAEHQDEAPSDFTEPGEDFRRLPTLSYLWAVVRRNAVWCIAIAFIISPFALFAILRAEKTYETMVLLKFDPSGSVDPQGLTQGSQFAAALANLFRETADLEFLKELARIYTPPRAPSVWDILPIPEPLQDFLVLRSAGEGSEDELVARARKLQKRFTLAVDEGQALVFQAQVTAYAASPQDAQLLAQNIADLLCENYLKNELRRVKAVHDALIRLMDSPEVKVLLEKLRSKSSSQDKGEGSKTALELKKRQLSNQEQIKELSARLAANQERKLKLEAEIGTLSQRYGKFHPQLQALKNEIGQANEKGTSGSVVGQMRKLREQLFYLEAESTALGTIPKEIDTPELMVERLNSRLELLAIERVSLEQQIRNPGKRTRLSLISQPAYPPNPLASPRLKLAIAAAAATVFAMLAFMILREFRSDRPRDEWRISFALNLPCLGHLKLKQLRHLPPLVTPVVEELRHELTKEKPSQRFVDALTSYRVLSHWLKNKRRGPVVLVAKGAQPAKAATLISSIANLYALDYAGRVLVIDFDSQDPITHPPSVAGEGSMLDYLDRRLAWDKVCLKPDEERSFDLVPAPLAGDQRLPASVSSERLAEFLKAANKRYELIILVGLGASHFVENSSLLRQATDGLIIVETHGSSLAKLKNLAIHLEARKLGGFVLVEG